ncbi:EamA family transporter [Leptolyngbya sp. NK1-12]|uniref:EamA family transporter n=1 Tax=Leptolyngbya sp. NK1-12 TaxID=2547451 RepID=A0AA97AH88_9CYAN|nr:EamA family transporter [Leptolyngbya sp. NK1-12]WNZ22516.1 EamA family transporter [Leptolyngbya sp. NK1-12]
MTHYDKSWWIFALLSAVFAALTAIFAKVGVENVNSNLATAIRTVVILIIAWGIVGVGGQWRGLFTISEKTMLFLVLSGIATGLSWLCYFKALQMAPASWVAPVDKLGLALVLILSFLFLGEAMTLKTILGAGLIMSGALVLIYPEGGFASATAPINVPSVEVELIEPVEVNPITAPTNLPVVDAVIDPEKEIS